MLPSPIPQPYPLHIEVVDLQACPESGQPQWIKLFNPDNQEYVLHKWHFYNSHNHKRVLNTSIGADSTITVYFRSHLFLKIGDTISLVRPDNTISFTIQTPTCTKKTVDDSFSSPPATSPPQLPPPIQQQLPQNIFTPPILQATTQSTPQNYDFANPGLETHPPQSQNAQEALTDPQNVSEGIGSSILNEENPTASASLISSSSAQILGSDMIVRPEPEPTQNKKPFPFVGIVLIGIILVLLLCGGGAAAYIFYKKQKGKNTL